MVPEGARLLREWRTAQDPVLTQGQFAELIGKKQSHVSRYESGTVPGWTTARKIAKVTKGKVPLDSWDRLEKASRPDPRRVKSSKAA